MCKGTAALDVAKFWADVDGLVRATVAPMRAALLGECAAVPAAELWPTEISERAQHGTQSAHGVQQATYTRCVQYAIQHGLQCSGPSPSSGCPRRPHEAVHCVTTACFHIVGFDVMLDQAGAPTLLEINCNPSLSLESVYPIDGTHVRCLRAFVLLSAIACTADCICPIPASASATSTREYPRVLSTREYSASTSRLPSTCTLRTAQEYPMDFAHTPSGTSPISAALYSVARIASARAMQPVGIADGEADAPLVQRTLALIGDRKVTPTIYTAAAGLFVCVRKSHRRRAPASGTAGAVPWGAVVRLCVCV